MAIQFYNKKIKNNARRLRRKGLSYKEIADKIGVAKSTARLWSNDIELKPEHKERLYTKRIEILTKGPYSQKERRKVEVDSIIKDAKNEIRLPILKETYRLMGAALYWAEGDKTQHFAVANSDPFLIKFMVRWMNDVLDVNPKTLKAHLNIYPQQNDTEIKKFWSKITGIPFENFGKSFIKPVSTGYKKNTLYYGTIKIRAPKGTDMRHRVFGWISAVLKDVEAEINGIERKWHKLKSDYKRP